LGSARMITTVIFFLMRTCIEEGKSKIPQVEITDLALFSTGNTIMMFIIESI
jgi:hypothetical protein